MRRRDFIASAATLAACSWLPARAGALTARAAAVPAVELLPFGFHNFTGANLPNWQAALEAQQRGASNAILGCLGDSTVAGQGAASNELASNAKSLSWPTQLANQIPDGSWSSVWGDNNIIANAGTLHGFDARLSRSGWSISAGKQSATLCGSSFYVRPGNNSHSFTPTNEIDTIDIWFARSPESGSFTVDVDGGAPLATIDCAGPEAFLKTTVACPLDYHTINLHQQSTAADTGIYLTALRAYNSQRKEVSVYNLGGCRWGSADFVVDIYPWSTLPAVAAISPNLMIFEAGIINDWDDRVPLATVTSNMRAVIKALRAVNCDVILMSGAPSEAGVYAPYETQAAYVANMRALAYAADVPFIDVWHLFGGLWQRAAMYDSLHPNQTGYALIAGYARSAVLNPAARSVS